MSKWGVLIVKCVAWFCFSWQIQQRQKAIPVTERSRRTINHCDSPIRVTSKQPAKLTYHRKSHRTVKHELYSVFCGIWEPVAAEDIEQQLYCLGSHSRGLQPLRKGIYQSEAREVIGWTSMIDTATWLEWKFLYILPFLLVMLINRWYLRPWKISGDKPQRTDV